MKKFIIGSVAFIAAFNLPFFFYSGIGFTFMEKRVSGSVVGAMYAYDWLPLVAVAALTIVEAIAVIGAKKKFSFSKKRKAMS